MCVVPRTPNPLPRLPKWYYSVPGDGSQPQPDHHTGPVPPDVTAVTVRESRPPV
jgi:hypothetical protein